MLVSARGCAALQPVWRGVPHHPPTHSLPSLQKTDKDVTIELASPRPDGSTTLTAALTTERDSADLANLKLRNLDYDRFATGGRSGVDDLIQLTHLHEPAILDVLSMRYAKECIYSA